MPKARRLGIRHDLFYPDGGEVHQVLSGDNAFVIISGGSFADFHDKVCFRELIRDACIRAPHTIPIQDHLSPSKTLASGYIKKITQKCKKITAFIVNCPFVA